MPASVSHAPPNELRLTTAIVLGLGLLALFLYAHPYGGMHADAEVYALQALSRLYPESLRGDMFFRFGSQDSYTVFPPLHAWLIGLLGLDQSAWLLSRAFLIALAAGALLLARACMQRQQAWLALALFILIPGAYGPHNVFAYGENVLTPRTLAEALSLLSLWLALSARWRASLATLAVALLLHPIMALPALLCVAALRAPARAPLLLGGGAALGLAAATVLAVLWPLGPIQIMDHDWRATLELLTPFLMAQQWWLPDWQRSVVPLATLAVAVIALAPGRGRLLAATALAIGAAGLALLLYSSFVAPIVLLVQGQAWRWTWLARAVAVLLLVPTGAALWRRGPNGVAVLALLAVGWYGSEDALGLEAALCAVAFAVLEVGAARPIRLLWAGGGALALLFGAGIVHLIGFTARLQFAAGAIAVWWLVVGARRAWLTALAALGTAAACGVQLAATLNAPLEPGYDAVTRALVPWQHRIGADQTVLNFGDGAWPWVALHRQSYFGNVGILFSRRTAMAMRARNDELQQRAGSDLAWFSAGRSADRPPPSLGTLRRLCGAPDLDFIVAPVSYPVPHALSNAPAPFDSIYLYDCRDLLADGDDHA